MLYKQKNILLYLVVSLQVSFFLLWSFSEQQKLSDPQAKDILVRTIAIDPRDLISGNYFILHYEFNDSWRFKKKKRNLYKKQGQIVYTVLQKNGLYYTPKYISYTMPKKIKEDQAIIKGKVIKYNRIEYGIERYFINENTSEPDTQQDKIEVLITIDHNFIPKIKDLYVNNLKFDQHMWKKDQLKN